MAFQDSGSIESTLMLYTQINGYSTQDGQLDSEPITMISELDTNIKLIVYIEPGLIVSNMYLNAEANGQIPNISESITMNSALDVSVNSKFIQNIEPVIMVGICSMDIKATSVYCIGEQIDFIPQKIYIDACNDKEADMIKRYKGDTYPLEMVFSKNGNHNIDGYTFKLYTQIDGQQLYVSTGQTMSIDHGLVIFVFDSDAVATTGSGVYEIKAITADIATYAHGKLEIIDTLAVS